MSGRSQKTAEAGGPEQREKESELLFEDRKRKKKFLMVLSTDAIFINKKRNKEEPNAGLGLLRDEIRKAV